MNFFQTFNKNNSLEFTILLITTIIITLLTITPIENSDIWWHLKSGEIFIKDLSLPKTDPFSYTAKNNIWTHHEWLFEVMIYPLFKITGFNGLIFLNTIIILLAAFFIIKSSQTFYNNLTAPCVTIAILSIFSRDSLVIRPHIFTLLFVSIYIYVLLNFKYKNKKKSIFILALVQIIWTNIHAGFIIGWAIIGLFFLGEIIELLITKKNNYNKKILKIFITGILIIIATLINPIGYKIILFPFEQVILKNIYMQNITEWFSPLHPYFKNTPIYLIYLTWLITSLVLIFLTFKKLEITINIIYIFFIILSYTGIRHAVMTFFLTAPFLAKNIITTILIIQKKLENLIKTKKINLKVNIKLLFFVLILFFNGLLFFYTLKITSNSFGLGGEKKAAKNVANYILRNKISGNMFNSFELGGYLIYRLFPYNKVFIDSRANIVYDNNVFIEYLESLKDPQILTKTIEKYNISFFVLEYPRNQNSEINKFSIYNYLDNSPMWVLLFFDDAALLYVKRDDYFKDLIEKDGYKTINPALDILKQTSDLTIISKNIEEYKKAVNILPDSQIAWTNLGLCYLKIGSLNEAISAFNNALQNYNANKAFIYSQLATIYYMQKSFDQSIAMLKKSIFYNNKNGDLYINLANLYLLKKDYSKATKYFKKAIKLTKDKNMANQIKDIIKALEQGKIK